MLKSLPPWCTKSSCCRVPFLLVLSVLAATAGRVEAAPRTWQNGGSGLFSSVANWVEGSAPVNGDTLDFGASTFTAALSQDIGGLTSVGNVTFTNLAPSYTITGGTGLTFAGGIAVNGAQTESFVLPTVLSGAKTVTIAAGGKLVLGSAATAHQHSMNNGLMTFTGAGEFNVLTTGVFETAQANTTTLDMSGLGKFVANVGTMRVMGTATSTATVRLSADNTIIATTLKIGDTLGGTTLADGVLRLGTANTLQVDAINLGSTRSDGTLNFDVGLVAPTVNITGKAGGASKAAMTLGFYQTNPNNYNPVGTVDFTGGTVNAQLSTLTVGQMAPNGAVTFAGTTSGTGVFTMTAGTATADTVRLGYWSGGNTAGSGTTQLANGTLNISGGTFTAGTAMRIGDGVVGAAGTTHARGTVNVSGTGVLNVSGLFLLGNDGGGGDSANQRGTLTITGGTVNANVAITTNNARSTLTLDGGTLNMNGNAIGSALQQIGSNGGALNFQSGTLMNVSEINGGAALIKTTAGTLILDGTNTYTGGTTIQAGTLQIGAGAATGTLGGGSVTNDATLNFNRSNAMTISNPISGSGFVQQIGSGVTNLTGSNSYTGVTNINAGTLLVNGTHTGGGVYTIASGGTLGGSGTIGSLITGAGLGSPGNSPGILTVSQINPSGGMDFAFEFTATGDPNWNNAAASVNDVWRITDGADPFAGGTFTAANKFDIYLGVPSLAAGNTFRGGIFTDLASDFQLTIAGASNNFWVLGDGSGTDATFNGQGYYSLANYNLTFAQNLIAGITVVPVGSANFASGAVNNGRVMQINIASAIVSVPEPAAAIAWMIALAAPALALRRLRKPAVAPIQ